MYWICGKRAYEFLPKVWSEKCDLGHIIPAMTALPILPTVHIINFTQTLGHIMNKVSALIPGYEVKTALHQRRVFSFSTRPEEKNTKLGYWTVELTTGEMMASQHHTTLGHFLPATTTRICAGLRNDCCHKIRTIKPIVRLMHKY